MFRSQVLLGVFALVPSLLLCYAVLSTFYRSSRAYLAICWVPLTLYVGIGIFLDDPGHTLNEYNLGLMLESVCWTSLFQGALGVGLLISAIAKKEGRVTLTIATLIAGLPFIIDRT